MTRSGVRSVVYIGLGPLIFIATLVVIHLATGMACASENADKSRIPVLVAVVSALGVIGAAVVLWRALTNQRAPNQLTSADRRIDFFAGALAVASMVAIGVTTLPAVISHQC